MNQKQSSIAIIGFGCRLPGGADSPELLWQLLTDRVDAIAPIPRERFDIRWCYSNDKDARGSSYVNEAGFIKQNIYEIDTRFFGLTPREAEVMDPQQRIMLEAAYDAMVDAGVTRTQLSEATTGTFVGGFCLDQLNIKQSVLNRCEINASTSAGTTMTMLSNRLSYLFDLTGPSLSVDTACSSSLVAAHLACRSIWCGDCDIALVGGVNVMLSSEYFVSMCAGRFLSPDARCQMFDANANGYVRGEGSCVLILKPLSQALDDGDNIYACIESSGSNQDGKTLGISLPNPLAQEKLIRSVYQRAGVSPDEVVYVEAHGTGTQQGDLAEATALNQVFSARQADNKCLVGSIKTNIGHLEAAAGVAGLTKLALCLHHRQVPPNLNFSNPNEALNLDTMNIKLSLAQHHLPQDGKIYAGINSFGYGGSNAHLLLSSAPIIERIKDTEVNFPLCFPLSAQTKPALTELAKRHLSRQAGINYPSQEFADYYYSLTCRTSHLQNRVALVAKDHAAFITQLEQFCEEKSSPNNYAGIAHDNEQKVTLVFSGMGPQWWGMGRELFTEDDESIQLLDQADAIFQPLAGWSLREELFKDKKESKVELGYIAQPLSFLVQIAYANKIAQYGVKADMVIGHSVGEISAAYWSGALSFEDATLVSYHRSRLQYTCYGQGGMLAVQLPVATLREYLQDYTNLSIAAVNSPQAITVSGADDELEQLSTFLNQNSIFNQRLRGSIPYHCEKMDPIKDELLESLQGITPKHSVIPFISTVTGDVIEGTALGADYWWENVRQPVEFLSGIQTCAAAGTLTYIEISAQPVLKSYIKECVGNRQDAIHVVETGHRRYGDKLQLCKLQAQLFAHGVPLNWEYIAPKANATKLPHYPWQREYCWVKRDNTRRYQVVQSNSPFLARRVNTMAPTWEIVPNFNFFPYVNDHVVMGHTIFPGTAYIEACAQINNTLFEQPVFTLKGVIFKALLPVNGDSLKTLRCQYLHQQISIWSNHYDDEFSWQQHFTATLHPMVEDDVPRETIEFESLLADKTPIPAETLYENLALAQLNYGSSFSCIDCAWQINDNAVVTKLSYPKLDKLGDFNALIHPGLLDSIFQSISAFAQFQGKSAYVPSSIDSLAVKAPFDTELWAHLELVASQEKRITVNITICRADGATIAYINGLTCEALEQQDMVTQFMEKHQSLYVPNWQQETWSTSATLEDNKDRWLVIHADDSHVAAQLLMEFKLTEIDSSQTPYTSSDMSKESYAAKLTVPEKPYNLLFVCPPDEKNFAQGGYQLTCFISQIIQHLLRIEQLPERMVVVTEDAHHVNDTTATSNLASSVMSGITFVLRNELVIKTLHLDISRNLASLQYDAVMREIRYNTDDQDIAIRSEGRYVKVLEPVAEYVAAYPAEVSARSNCCHLVNSGWEIASDHENDSSSMLNVEYIVASPSNLVSTKHLFYGEQVRSGSETQPVLLYGNETVSTQIAIHDSELIKVTDELTPKQLANVIPFALAARIYHDILTHQENEPIAVLGINAITHALATLAASYGVTLLVIAYDQDNVDSLVANNIALLRINTSGQIIDTPNGYTLNGIKYMIEATECDAFVPLLKQQHQLQAVITCRGDLTSDLVRAFSKQWIFINDDLLTPDVIEKQVQIVSNLDADQLIEANVIYSDDTQLQEKFYESRSNALTVLAVKPTVHVQRKQVHLNLSEGKNTYLITGGVSGFGLQLALWLSKKGAAQVILVSRRGVTDSAGDEIIKLIRTNGTDVVIRSCDVCSQESVRQLFEQINQSAYTLKGIFHCAMVLDDGFILDMNNERYAKVMNPKLLGAYYLHECSLAHELDYFVCTSSISSIIGKVGQVNYVAANSLLDELSYYRRAQGLPAFTLNIGVISDVGVIARSEQLIKYVGMMSINGTPVAEVLDILEFGLATALTELVICDFDWQKVLQTEAAMLQCSRFKKIAARVKGDSEDSDFINEIKAILDEDPDEAEAVVCVLVKEVVGELLSIETDQIFDDTKLSSLGVDSLMVSELRNNLAKQFTVEINIVDLLKGVSIRDIAAMLIEQLITA